MKSRIKHHFLLLIMMLAAGLVFVMNPKTVKAETTDHEIVLSGEIGGMEIDKSVQRVILAGVNQSEDTQLTIKGDVVIEIQDGTENKLTSIDASGNVEFVGDGNLEVPLIFISGEMLVFDHTGEIVLPLGGISSTSCDIYFNSGTVKSGASEDTAFGVFTYRGNIYVNGGHLSAAGYNGAIYAGSHIYLEGGEIDALATGGAAFTAGRGEPGSITMSEEFSLEYGMSVAEVESTIDGVTVTSIVDEEGNGAPAVIGEGPDSEEQIESSAEKLDEIMYTKTDVQNEESVTDSSEDTFETDSVQEAQEPEETKADTVKKKKNISPAIIIVICIAAAAAVAAIGVFPQKKKKGKR